ncbi:MAG: hypothetical protein ABW000_23865 [Actinoplanes sp.]
MTRTPTRPRFRRTGSALSLFHQLSVDLPAACGGSTGGDCAGSVGLVL